MPTQNITIDNIFDGIAPTQYFASKGSYNSAIGVDPDFPISSSDIKKAGFLVPTAYTDFSGANLTVLLASAISMFKILIIR